MVTRGKYYNRTNTCEECGKDLLSDSNPQRGKDEKGNWNGKWFCKKCGLKKYYHNYYKKRPDCLNNIRKLLRNRRIGNLNINSTQAFGDLCEEITCRWRKVKNLNIEYDNYKSQLDHSEDQELGIIQTKGARLTIQGKIYEKWAANLKNEYAKEYDHLIFYCISKNREKVERIYIFPKEDIKKKTTIVVLKNAICGWYEKFRLDNNTVNYVNNIFQNILREKGLL